MPIATTVAAYLAVGFAINSGLHTWYASKVYGRLSFGLPFSAQLRTDRAFRDGYIGAGLLGVLVFALTMAFFSTVLSDSRLTVEAVLDTKLDQILLGSVGLLLGSQLVGGSTWSKVILDGALLFMGFIVYIAHLQPPSFWNLFTVYAAIIPPLGGAWGVWREYFIRNQITTDEEVPSVLYPHFPSFTYFIGSSAYLLLVALYLIVPSVE